MEAVDDRGAVKEVPLHKRAMALDGAVGNHQHTLRSTGPGRITLLEYLASKRYWIICCTTLAFGSAALYLHRNPVRYVSSVVLLLRDQELPPTEKPGYLPDLSPNHIQLFHLPTSTEMVDHLVGKFNLYEHYGIDKSTPLHYARISDRLVNSITVRHLDENCVVISVADEDRALAANMANALYDKLQEMNERQTKAALDRKIALYQQVITRTQRTTHEQASKLEDVVSEFNRLKGNIRSTDPASDRITALNFQLADLVAQLSMANQDLSNARKNYEISAALLEQQELPDIHLVRSALEDITTSKVLTWANTLLFASFGGLFLTLLLLTLWYKHGHEVKGSFADLNAPSDEKLNAFS